MSMAFFVFVVCSYWKTLWKM